MRNSENHGELLARIDERTKAIENLINGHLTKYESRNVFLNKALLFLLVLILLLNIDKAAEYFSFISKAFAG